MNLIFFLLIAIAFVVAAYRQLTFDPSPLVPATDAAGATVGTAIPLQVPMDAMTTAVVEAAETAVELAIGLIGVMALFIGLMAIVEAAGGLAVIARVMKPLMVRLFPDIPPDHPAMGAMIMNISANFLGLGNAATPFGLKAMEELDKLNPVKGTATNAMVLFLAINTAGLTLLPTSVVALRAQAGSTNPAGIVATTIFATATSMIVAIAAAKLMQRFFSGGESVPESVLKGTAAVGELAARNAATHDTAQNPMDADVTGYPLWVSVVALLAILAAIPLTVIYGKVVSPWIIPTLIVGMVLIGMLNKVPVYEVFIEGAKDGFNIAVKIIPYLVAILVSVAMFRASSAMDLLLVPLGKLTALVGLPIEGLTMAMMRSLSGSGAFGLLASFLKDPAIGPDSYTGYLVSTMYGSTETTFYVLAVYFGAVQVRRIRHALAVGLVADAAAVVAAIAVCTVLYG
ncbi:MAG: spore maturation protein [Cyanobacteria bacterium HKST-UBA03]|nr:spore maturation protein [Cyanobacteria bacterium HKST-UBA03]